MNTLQLGCLCGVEASRRFPGDGNLKYAVSRVKQLNCETTRRMSYTSLTTERLRQGLQHNQEINIDHSAFYQVLWYLMLDGIQYLPKREHCRRTDRFETNFNFG